MQHAYHELYLSDGFHALIVRYSVVVYLGTLFSGTGDVTFFPLFILINSFLGEPSKTLGCKE